MVSDDVNIGDMINVSNTTFAVCVVAVVLGGATCYVAQRWHDAQIETAWVQRCGNPQCKPCGCAEATTP